MKNIKALFLKQQEKNPLWGDYICLAEAVRGRKFTRNRLGQAMNKLVNESMDYESDEKKQYLDHLESLSNPLVERKNEAVNPLQYVLISKKVICTDSLFCKGLNVTN